MFAVGIAPALEVVVEVVVVVGVAISIGF